MNDATTGALIPYIRSSYDVGLLFVALVYLTNFCGSAVAAFTNVHLTARFGMGGVYTGSALVIMLAYALNAWKPPFPLFACSYFFSGLGIAFMDAQANTYVANLDNAHRWLGILHSIYGVGGLISPLAATALASHTPHWYYFYLVLLGTATLNTMLLAWNFRDGLFKPTEQVSSSDASRRLKDALTQRSVWVMSLFFFLYVGVEVTAGGWVVEFLISVRNGSPSQVGYVASGFWAGLALGRFVLADVTHKFGERRMVMIYIVLGLAMQLLFWFVPNVVANAVVISLLGFIIAPFFPVGVSILTKLLPKDLHIASIGFSATVGQAGSAAFPFLTGAVASRVGVIVLQPIMVGLFGGMFVLWALMPRVRKHRE
ncbi:MFS general substrate transporter [Thozetella sp. PMI_491]|nr:MFS general substrate transporter [Thozetella sp. PMI_491]